MVSTVTEPRSTPEYIANVGERFLLKFYGAIRSTSLDKLRYILYTRSVGHLCHQGSNLSHCRQLSQPNSIHAMPILQCNNGLATICAQLAGWQYRDGSLVTLTTDRPVAPTRVLQILRLQNRLLDDMRMPEGRDVLFTHVQSV